jgi:hypothetical protein
MRIMKAGVLRLRIVFSQDSAFARTNLFLFQSLVGRNLFACLIHIVNGERSVGINKQRAFPNTGKIHDMFRRDR